MFEELEKINERPEPFQFYTARDLWTDEQTSRQTLSYHLNEGMDVSSRNDEEMVSLDKYTIVESERVKTIFNWLQYFAPRDLENEFREAGFSVEGLCSDVAGTPYDRRSSEFSAIANRV